MVQQIDAAPRGQKKRVQHLTGAAMGIRAAAEANVAEAAQMEKALDSLFRQAEAPTAEVGAVGIEDRGGADSSSTPG